jgi:hypothetical protein
MMVRKFTDSTPLLQELSRDLLRKSTGIYDTSMSFLEYLEANYYRFLLVYLQLEMIWDQCFIANGI